MQYTADKLLDDLENSAKSKGEQAIEFFGEKSLCNFGTASPPPKTKALPILRLNQRASQNEFTLKENKSIPLFDTHKMKIENQEVQEDLDEEKITETQKGSVTSVTQIQCISPWIGSQNDANDRDNYQLSLFKKALHTPKVKERTKAFAQARLSIPTIASTAEQIETDKDHNQLTRISVAISSSKQSTAITSHKKSMPLNFFGGT